MREMNANMSLPPLTPSRVNAVVGTARAAKPGLRRRRRLPNKSGNAALAS